MRDIKFTIDGVESKAIPVEIFKKAEVDLRMSGINKKELDFIISKFKFFVHLAKTLERANMRSFGLCEAMGRAVNEAKQSDSLFTSNSTINEAYNVFNDVVLLDEHGELNYYPFGGYSTFVGEKKHKTFYQNKDRLKAIDTFISELEKLK